MFGTLTTLFIVWFLLFGPHNIKVSVDEVQEEDQEDQDYE